MCTGVDLGGAHSSHPDRHKAQVVELNSSTVTVGLELLLNCMTLVALTFGKWQRHN